VKPKPPVPLRYWLLWLAILVVADIAFYVVLTPIWIGLRSIAWLAEFRSRKRRQESSRVASGSSPSDPTL
jgi:hypothetical protein